MTETQNTPKKEHVNQSGIWEERWHPLRQEWVVVAAHRQNRPWSGEMVENGPRDGERDEKADFEIADHPDERRSFDDREVPNAVLLHQGGGVGHRLIVADGVGACRHVTANVKVLHRDSCQLWKKLEPAPKPSGI